MEAKQLQIGQDFKLKGQRKFRTVTRIYNQEQKFKYDGDKILLLVDNCKQMTLDPSEEVIIKDDDIILPSVFLANERMEYKEIAVTSVSYPHQGLDFHPCFILMYWIRWGKYVFDIRQVRGLFGKLTEQCNDIEIGQEAFTIKIETMLKMIGDEPFADVLKRLYATNEETRKKSDLPF